MISLPSFIKIPIVTGWIPMKFHGDRRFSVHSEVWGALALAPPRFCPPRSLVSWHYPGPIGRSGGWIPGFLNKTNMKTLDLMI